MKFHENIHKPLGAVNLKRNVCTSKLLMKPRVVILIPDVLSHQDICTSDISVTKLHMEFGKR